MIIKRITIGGYKNIDKLDIDFSNITAFIGVNGFGKSNVLQAIDYGIKFIRETPEGKERMMRYIQGIPINKKLQDRNFIFNIEYLTQRENKKEIFVEYEYEFEWARQTCSNKKEYGCRIINEFLKVKENNKGKKYNTRIKREKELSYYKSSDTGRCDKAIKIDYNNLILNKLKHYDELFYLDIIEELNNIKTNIDLNSSFNYNFDLWTRSRRNFLHNLKDEKCDIERIVWNLKKYDNEKYEQLKSIFLYLCPNIEDIDVNKTDIDFFYNKEKSLYDKILNIDEEIYRIKIKEKTNNQYVGFESLASGNKIIFLFLTDILLADIDKVSIIAYEELELWLHPSLFRKLIESIKAINTSCRIILTSHSTHLLEHLNIDDIYIGVPIYDGIARFYKIKKSKQKMIEIMSSNIHMRKVDYIFKLLSDFYEDNLNNELLLYLNLEDND